MYMNRRGFLDSILKKCSAALVFLVAGCGDNMGGSANTGRYSSRGNTSNTSNNTSNNNTNNNNTNNNNNNNQNSCTVGGAVVQTDGVHPHNTFTINPVDIQAASSGIYVLLGGNHSHTFNISSSQMQSLLDGQQVFLNGDREGHGHRVTIVC